MSTVSDLIKGSLRLLGVIAQGETPTAQESADALSSLNDMLDSWSNDGLLLFDRTIESLSIVASTASYTIGTGGVFNTARPVRIIEAAFKQSGSNEELPLNILTSQEWARAYDKTLTSSLLSCLYYNDTFPLGTIYVWPVPTASGTLVLTSDKPLSNYSAISDSVTLPPGYKKALRYNLALELAPEYGKQVSEIVFQQATESKANIMRTNTETILLKSDALGMVNPSKPFNIIAGF